MYGLPNKPTPPSARGMVLWLATLLVVAVLGQLALACEDAHADPMCGTVACGPTPATTSGSPAFDAGVRLAAKVWGPSTRCPAGVRFGPAPITEGAHFGGDCRIWVFPLVGDDDQACTSGLHEAGHAIYGLDHSATGIMRADVTVVPLCARWARDARAKRRCLRDLGRCERRSPRLARRVAVEQVQALAAAAANDTKEQTR